MSHVIVKDLPPLKTVTSSGGAAVTNAIGNIEDASSITLYFQTTAIGASPAGIIQVSMFNPALATSAGGEVGTVQSSNFLSLTSVTSSASAQTLTNISFRGLRISFTASSSSNGEIVAYATKQISV